MTQPVKIAYLEISPRMTGKTTRLCKFANNIAATGKPVIYICQPPLVEGLRREMPGVTVLADGEPVPEGIDVTNAVWFYDEFDWLASTIIRDGGYYATTAKKLRNAGTPLYGDILMGLLKANGNRHERHYMPSFLWEFVCDNRAVMPPETFRMSMLGEFLS